MTGIDSFGGLVFCGRRCTQAVCHYGINQELTCLRSPPQNGMVERLIRSARDQYLRVHNFASPIDWRQALNKWLQV